MKFFTGKTLLIAGFVLVLLIGIPLSVYLIQQQQDLRSEATPSTVLSFTPASTESSPIQAQVGGTVPLDVQIDPGNNLVSFLRLEINYDPDKLATSGAQPFLPNTTVFPTIIEGPFYSEGKILVTLSIGGDPTKAISAVGSAGTVTFRALAETGNIPTQVSYGSRVEVFSIAGPSTGSNDQANENVLSSTSPAFVAVGPGTGVTGSPTPTQPVSSITPSPGAANNPPTCQSFVIDRAASGNAPYSVTFTATGTDSDGTIDRATFNFGDGPVVTETVGGGLGSNQVSVQKAHTYNNGGTSYTATVIFTDNNGNVSTVGSCSQTITVTTGSGTSGGSGGTGSQTPTDTPTPTPDPNAPTPTPTTVAPSLEPTGPGEVFLGLGAVIGVITLIGGILFFAL